jgi:hypothetical protein
MKFANPFASNTEIKRSFSVLDSDNLLHLITDKHNIFINKDEDLFEYANINTYLKDFQIKFSNVKPTLSNIIFNYTIVGNYQ